MGMDAYTRPRACDPGGLNADPERPSGCISGYDLLARWAELSVTTFVSETQTTMGTIDKGPCKIAAFSGYTGDRFDALKTQAEGSGAPILFGDYLAEMVSTQWG